MREFSEFEKDAIRIFVKHSTFVCGITKCAEEIFEDKICVVKDQGAIKIYVSREESAKWGSDKKYITSYMKLLYFIGLLMELERDILIIISTNYSNSFIPLNTPYDSKHQPYELNEFYKNKIEYYLSSNILVSQQLVSIVNNNFKTDEQIRFDKQLKEAKRQTGGAYIAAGVSFLGLLVALILPFCTKTKLAEINDIKQEIRDSKTKLPAVIETKITNDTIKVDNVKPTPIKKE